MILVLLGPPGAGKGTQAARIVDKYDIPHISTGDIFRKNIKEGTKLGKEAKEYINQGQLVPDELVVEIVKSRIVEEDCKDGFLLDGFPRNVFQASTLDKVLEELSTKIDKVINISVDKEILVERAVGRRICKECGATFHIEFNPTKESGICDVCGGQLYQREDDKAETVSKRIEVYLKETAPLIDYYSEQGNIINIDGQKHFDTVFKNIVEALGSDQ